MRQTLLLAHLITAALLTPLLPASAQSSGVQITMREFGAEELAYLSLPDVAPSAGVILIPGPPGLSSEIQLLSDDLARRGLLALAVDLYGGKTARTEEEKQALQKEVGEAYAQKVIEAGLRLFEESPRYQMPKVVLAVWDSNLDLTLQALRRSKHSKNVIGLTVLQPRGDFNPDLIERYRFPFQFILEKPAEGPHPWSEKLQRLEERRKADMHVEAFPAPRGFLLTPGDPHMPQAWTRVADFWLRLAQRPPEEKKSFFGRVWDSVTP